MRMKRVTTLTAGEALMLIRRRKGLTQTQFGKKFGLGQVSISSYETGLRAIHRVIPPKWFTLDPKELTKGENLRMLRYRMGLSVNEMAEKMRISRVTYFKREAVTDCFDKN